MEKQILVLGATGKTGKRVARQLKKMGLPVRAGSRNENPSFDWDRPENWAAVLGGIEKVYLTVQPDFAVPGVLEKVGLLVDAAKKSGVKKIVLLSGRGEKEAEEGENIVINSGLAWTIVRASWFMQNFSEYFFLDYILQGQVIVPGSTAPEPFVDVDDIAEVVVAALTQPGHDGKIYELTGPESLSIKEATAMISGSINRPVAYREVEPEEFKQLLRQVQTPEDIIGLLEYLFTEILDGRNELPAGDVKKVLGREAGSFKEYIEKTVKSGVWNPKNQIA